MPAARPSAAWTLPRRRLAWLAIAAVGLALLWWLSPVLTPFLVGAVLAYALHPAVEALAARRVPRVLAVLAVETAFILALLALLLLMVPILAKELPLLREQIPLLAERANQTLVPWLRSHGIPVALDTASVKAFVLKYLDANLEDWLATALSSARIGGSIVLAIIGNAVLMPVVLYYLLMDWPKIVARVEGLVPPRLRPATADFLGECDAVLGQYLRGQLLVMALLAVGYSIGLALFGFDLAVPLGVFTGLAGFIPYLGFGLGLVLALLAGLLQFGAAYALVAVAVVFGIGQVLESFVLTPRLVGERIGLNPLTVIFALLAFGHLLGFVGVLVALPLSAVAAVAIGRLRRAYLASPLFLGR
ncbi:AI-2E family transporter [Piscinibacter sakaiensis]|uniref:AI-2E family transporter n=1 Tax=Piscinibacter sakaiensis TaxID=1547922 RepID=UPI0006B5A373